MARTQEIVQVLFDLKDQSATATKKIVSQLEAVNKSLENISNKKPSTAIQTSLKNLAKYSDQATASLKNLNAALGTKGAIASKLNTITTASNKASKSLKELSSSTTLKSGPIITESKKIVTALNSITAAATKASKAMRLQVGVAPVAAATTQATKAPATTSTRKDVEDVVATTEALKNQAKASQAVTSATKERTQATAASQQATVGQNRALVSTKNTFSDIQNSITTTQKVLDRYRNAFLGTSKTQEDWGRLSKETSAQIGKLNTQQEKLIGLETRLQSIGGQGAQKQLENVKKLYSGTEALITSQTKYSNLAATRAGASKNLSAEEKTVASLKGQYDGLSTKFERVTTLTKEYNKSLNSVGNTSKENATQIAKRNTLLNESSKILDSVTSRTAEWEKVESAQGKQIASKYKDLQSSVRAYGQEQAKVVKALEGRKTHLTTLAEEGKVLSSVKQSYKDQVQVIQESKKALAEYGRTEKDAISNSKELKAANKALGDSQKDITKSLQALQGIGAKGIIPKSSFAPVQTALQNLQKQATATGKTLSDKISLSEPVKRASIEIKDLKGQLKTLESSLQGISSRYKTSTGDIRAGMTSSDFENANTQLSALKKQYDRLGSSITNLSKRGKGEIFAAHEKDINSLTAAIEKSKKSVQGFNKSLSDRSTELGPYKNILAENQRVAASMRAMTEAGATMGTSIQRSFHQVGNAFGLSLKGIDDYAGAISHLEKELVRFRSGVVTWSIGLLMFSTALATPFVAAINIFRRLTDSLQQVAAVTRATEDEFIALTEAASEMGRTTRFTAEQAAQGLLFLGRAGFTANEAIEALPTTLKLAAGAAIELGKAADIVTNVMTSFGLAIAELPKAADVLTLAVNSSNATLSNLGFGFTYVGSIARGLGGDFEDLIAALAKLHDAGFKGCSDDQTEVLTKDKSFVLFKDLKPTDEVMTLNPDTLEMEWQLPTAHHVFDIEEDLFHVETKSVNMAVTDNHRLFFDTRNGNQLIREAKDFKEGRFHRTGIWKGNNPEFFTLSGFAQNRGTWNKQIQNLNVPVNDWVDFLGWYLAEGSLGFEKGNYKVVVSQSDKKPEQLKKLTDLLDRLPFHFRDDNGRYICVNQQLYKELETYGKGFNGKRVPEYVKNYSPKILQVFYEGFRLGDGDDQNNLYTSNKKLARDLYEVVLKCGWAAQIKMSCPAGTPVQVTKESKPTVSTEDAYIVQVSKCHTNPYISIAQEENRKNTQPVVENFIGWKPYKGKVYSVSVPNTIVYIQRNGRGHFTGNSMAGTSLRGALDGLFNPTKQEAEVMEQLSERMGVLSFNLKDAEGNFVGFTEVIRQLESVGFTAEEALKLFGQRAGPGIAALLRIGSDALTEYKDSLEDAAGTTDKIAEQMSETLQGKFLKALSAAQGLAESFGHSLEGGLKLAADVVADLINSFTDLRESLGPVTVVIDYVVAGLVVMTAALGALTFSWFLMIVPIKQFAAGFRTLTALQRDGFRKLLDYDGELGKSRIALVKRAASMAVDSNRIKENTANLKANTQAEKENNFSKIKTPTPRSTIALPVYKKNTRELKKYGLQVKKVGKAQGVLGSVFSSIGDLLAIMGVKGAAAFTQIAVAAYASVGLWRTATENVDLLSKAFEGLKKAMGFLFKIAKLHPWIAGLTILATTAYFLRDAFKSTEKALDESITKIKEYNKEFERSLLAVDKVQKKIAEFKGPLDDSNEKAQILKGSLSTAAEALVTAIQKIQNNPDLGIEIPIDIDVQFEDGELVHLNLLTKDGTKNNLIFSDSLNDIRDSVNANYHGLTRLNSVLQKATKIQGQAVARDQMKLYEDRVKNTKEEIQTLQERSDELLAYHAATKSAQFAGQNREKIQKDIEEERISIFKEMISLSNQLKKTEAKRFEATKIGLDLEGKGYEDQLAILRKYAEEKAKNLRNSFKDLFTKDTVIEYLIEVDTENIFKELIDVNSAILNINKTTEEVQLADKLRKALHEASKLTDQFEKLDEKLKDIKEESEGELDELFKLDEGALEANFATISESLDREIDAVENQAAKRISVIKDGQKQELRILGSSSVKKDVLEEDALKKYKGVVSERTKYDELRVRNAYRIKRREIAIEEDKNVQIYNLTRKSIEERRVALDEFEKNIATRSPQLLTDEGSLTGEASRKLIEQRLSFFEEDYANNEKYLKSLVASREGYNKRIESLEKDRVGFIINAEKTIKNFLNRDSKKGTDEDSEEGLAKQKLDAERQYYIDRLRIFTLNSLTAEAARNKDLASLKKYYKEYEEITKRTTSAESEGFITISPIEEALIKNALKHISTSYKEASLDMERDSKRSKILLDARIAGTTAILKTTSDALGKLSEQLAQTFGDESVFNKFTDSANNLTDAMTTLVKKFEDVIYVQKELARNQIILDKNLQESKDFTSLESAKNELSVFDKLLRDIDFGNLDPKENADKLKIFTKGLKTYAQNLSNIPLKLAAIKGVPNSLVQELTNLAGALGQDWTEALEKVGTEDTAGLATVFEKLKTAMDAAGTSSRNLGRDLETAQVSILETLRKQLSTEEFDEFKNALDSIKETLEYAAENLNLELKIEAGSALSTLNTLRESLQAVTNQAFLARAAVASVGGATVTVEQVDPIEEKDGGYIQTKRFKDGGYVETAVPRLKDGGHVRKFAPGGSVQGPGTGVSDSVLAWLSNGEYVMDSFTTKFFGSGFFKGLQDVAKNKIRLPKFSVGGLVDSASASLSGTSNMVTTPINLFVEGHKYPAMTTAEVALKMRREFSNEISKRSS